MGTGFVRIVVIGGCAGYLINDIRGAVAGAMVGASISFMADLIGAFSKKS